jgi:hypothetical protein
MMTPFGRLMERGFVASWTFFLRVLAITNIDVAPVSAMAFIVGIDNAFGRGRADVIACGRGMFDVTIVTSLLLI